MPIEEGSLGFLFFFMNEVRLTDYLKKNNLKVTKQRLAILDVFLGMEHHVSLDELHFSISRLHPNIGLATIYRTMKLFVEANIAHDRRFDDGPTRYEVVEEGEHHDHLICTRCGHIFEFEDEIIEERQEKIAKELGLRIKSHKLEIYGECVDLAKCDARISK